jgi:hypothetical protein
MHRSANTTERKMMLIQLGLEPEQYDCFRNICQRAAKILRQHELGFDESNEGQIADLDKLVDLPKYDILPPEFEEALVAIGIVWINADINWSVDERIVNTAVGDAMGRFFFEKM